MSTSRYKAELVKFMSFKDDKEYTASHEFTPADLLSITPGLLCRWMNTRAYGDSEPSEDMRPVHLRSSTLEFAKKAISAYMPRINAPWDPVAMQGNPTRSDDVNKLIKRVKRFEVRREGAESKARRSFEFDEFMNVLTLVRSLHSRSDEQLMVSSVLTLQWHIVARIDDMMKLQFNNFTHNTQYPSTILCQMRWSKNISEERDAPEQIVVGSMDPRMCPLLNLAVYIEATVNVARSSFLFGNPNDKDRVVRRFLADTIKKSEFKSLKTGKLGTHSFRKGAATYATRSGVVDVYIDNTQPYPDACTAAVLAGPAGPCFYSLKEGMRCVTTPLLVDEIAPTIKQVMGEPIAKTLAQVLLWAALETDSSFNYCLLPEKLKKRILRAYINAGGSTNLNPIQRQEFYVLGDGSQLNLVVIDKTQEVESGVGSIGTQREIAAVQSQIASGRRYMAEVMNEVLRSRSESHREMQKIQAILRRIAMQPPKDLYELWHEYQLGSGGLKPAKEFTSIERGANNVSNVR
ncbi:uncharacterized protein PITG_15104 [Phytophthora infestans T30-4]|uniref:Uncharacterized protein n=2 Tax=Phytophthora infestans (strain T30-4) TaxID=403677 RepID=D0NRN8_PHYIT|nr:uncharacterized protein PITG_15104 [Phytophthora infestans T30-4]EEY63388.1 conserved hypothetical protein [Phytophthora infestans T30-4]|eukprot:XP_002898273.1 conserved hypothetical protein [Phytophthora infestans T30-4]